MTTITLNIPNQVLDQARQAAALLQSPVETVLTDMLSAVLPPLKHAPAEVQAKLLQMTWLDNQALWAIAKEQMPLADQEEMRSLSNQQEQSLSDEQKDRLKTLQEEYGHITLYKARAYALLSLRGGKPLLSDL